MAGEGNPSGACCLVAFKSASSFDGLWIPVEATAPLPPFEMLSRDFHFTGIETNEIPDVNIPDISPTKFLRSEAASPSSCQHCDGIHEIVHRRYQSNGELGPQTRHLLKIIAQSSCPIGIVLQAQIIEVIKYVLLHS